jgi:hypothetical protein
MKNMPNTMKQFYNLEGLCKININFMKMFFGGQWKEHELTSRELDSTV